MNQLLSLNTANAKTLIIFPHAGGLPIQYKSWIQDSKLESFNVLYYQRSDIKTWEEHINNIVFELKKLPDDKLYFFGHSMGALSAYYASKQLKERSIELVLSSMNPPSPEQIERFIQMANLSSDAFMTQLESFGGIPQELKEKADLQLTFAPKIQTDFKLLASIAHYKSNGANRHRYHYCISMSDKIAQLQKASAWSQYFTSSGPTKIFAGDHFYLFKSPQEIHTYLFEVLQN